MNGHPDAQDEPARAEAAHDMARWTRRYAQSRTVPVAVGLVVYLVLVAVLTLLWHQTGHAYRAGQMGMVWLCAVGLVVAHAFVVWISVPKWGGKWLERTAWRYYAAEGSVKVHAAGPSPRQRRIGLIVGLMFGICMLVHVGLGLGGYLSVEHLQPVSALYVVPFLVALFLLMRPNVGWVSLIWPGLYALHAGLYAIGVPIRFTGDYAVLNVGLPIVGYGILTALVGHVYNRMALRHLKRLGRAGAGPQATASSERS